MDFKIQAPFEPAGDQPQAIAKLAEGVEQGLRTQVRARLFAASWLRGDVEGAAALVARREEKA